MLESMGSLGERRSIELLTRILGVNRRLPLGFNDDVAAVPITSRSWMVVKCDMLVQRTDVPPGMTHFDIGRKAVVSTVSDFAAKGVRPRGLMVSLGLPRKTSRKRLCMIGRGLASASKEYRTPIVGGDTNESPELVIDVSGFGWANPREIVRRDGAQPGDIVALTGLFGNSAAGLRLMLSKSKILPEDRALARAVKRPVARLKEGLALAKTRAVTSSIDSSDGLAWSLHELARCSKVGIRLERIALSPRAASYAVKHRLNPVDLALYGGEEYELVVTVNPDRFALVKRSVPSLIAVGFAVIGSGVSRVQDGRALTVERRGWEHFKKRK